MLGNNISIYNVIGLIPAVLYPGLMVPDLLLS
jgi:hypothetical protein